MPKNPRTNTSRGKVQAHRSRPRARGLRSIQIWVPDVRLAAFRAQADAQSLAVGHSLEAGQDQRFIDAVSDLEQP